MVFFLFWFTEDNVGVTELGGANMNGLGLLSEVKK